MTDAPVVVWEGSPKLRDFLVPIESLAPHPENPRVGNVDVVAGSLARFGQRTPIVAASQLIYKGNHTWRAARDVLGWTHIAVLSGDDLAEDELDAYLLADNRSSDLAVNDDEKLMAALQRLADRDGLAGTGYSSDDYAELKAELERRAEAFEPVEGLDPPRLDERKNQRSGGFEVTLVLGDDVRTGFVAQVRMLKREWAIEDTTAVVLRAVREAAQAL